ncbi:MAG: sulfotransferase [Planctomycetes bacterium]|nr:sulfotransferase [Planctomycetota bacterium]
MTTSFRTSPFFIIGMPRSGTKLLRALLNNHSDIHIPSEESEFIPYWLKKWNAFGNLQDMDQFVKFYSWTSTLPFFLSRDNRDKAIGIDHWYGNCLAFDPPGVFMGLLKSIAQHEKPTASVLGDKSPSYINELEVLKAQFPDAVMIHSRRKDPTEILEFCDRYNGLPDRKPLVLVPSSYNTVREEELAEAGANIVIYANHMLRSAYPAMQRAAKSILEHGRSADCEDQCLSIKEILDLIPGTR